MGAEGLELIEAFAEQLGQAGLGTMHPEAAMELPQFIGTEICGIRPLTFTGGGARIVAAAAHALQKPGVGDQNGDGTSQAMGPAEQDSGQGREGQQTKGGPAGWGGKKPVAQRHGPQP